MSKRDKTKVDRSWYIITPNMYDHFTTPIDEAIRQAKVRLNNLLDKKKLGKKVIHRRTHIKNIDGVLITFHKEKIALVSSEIKDPALYENELGRVRRWMKANRREMEKDCSTVCEV